MCVLIIRIEILKNWTSQQKLVAAQLAPTLTKSVFCYQLEIEKKKKQKKKQKKTTHFADISQLLVVIIQSETPAKRDFFFLCRDFVAHPHFPCLQLQFRN